MRSAREINVVEVFDEKAGVRQLRLFNILGYCAVMVGVVDE